MKHKIYILLIALCVIMSGCGKEEPVVTSKLEEVHDLSDATITMPSVYAGAESEELNAVTSGENADDSSSVTYEIDGETRTELVNQIAKELQESIDTILADKYYYPNIENITVNEDASEFTIYLTCDTPNLYESTLMMSFYTIGNRYQIYHGTPAKEAVTTVVYVNATTNTELARTDSTSISQ